MDYKHISVPADGRPVTLNADFSLNVPDNPVIPCIEGDGIGADVTPVMRRVVDAAVQRAYGGDRRIAWMDVYAGGRAVEVYGENQWLPEETLDALRRFVVSIKGPLMTPIGGGIRSLNVAIRQAMDLYACVRPVRYFEGVSSPVTHARNVDMVIYRENTEDIYAGIEWAAGSEQARRLIAFLEQELGVAPFAHAAQTGIGIKPVSQPGSARLVRKAIRYAIDNDRRSVSLVHKGNIMKFTEGAFLQWGYQVARDEFGAKPLDGGPWMTLSNPHTGREILIRDVIADNFLQQILLAPQDYDVVATLNLNGDYISDALAAQVGGIGIAPGANFGDGVAVFEATHGTAPDIAGEDKANPGSLLLSSEMMLRHMGWCEAADLVVSGLSKTIENKSMTYDLAVVREPGKGGGAARLLPGATVLGTRAFGDAIIASMAG